MALDDVKLTFLQSVSDLLEQAKKNAKTAVNLSMVYTYYEVGKRIFKRSKTARKELVMESIY